MIGSGAPGSARLPFRRRATLRAAEKSARRWIFPGVEAASRGGKRRHALCESPQRTAQNGVGITRNRESWNEGRSW
jgi:hypothetical protein